ncbi:MAG: 1-phosphofructokinase [Myxococcaceae bacterium]
MIISLTVNPAVDQTAWVERLEPGTVHRVRDTQVDPAGKGVNVSRVVHRLGWPTVAFGFLAGDTGALVEKALDQEGVQHHFVRVPGQTRVNLTVVDHRGSSTSFRGAGPRVDPPAAAALEAALRFWLQAGKVLVLAGSLPPGIPQSAYAHYVALARAHGVLVVVDADGEPLREGIAAGPDLVKPNVAEAEHLLGRRLPDVPAVLEGAREIVRRGVGSVVISMGAAGAVCASGKRAWRVWPPPVVLRSTVGPGDAMVAGLAVALARGEGVEEGLRLGTAAGAATASSEGTSLASPEQMAALQPQVRIEALR